MKKISVQIALSILMLTTITAQNYQPVYSHRTALFDGAKLGLYPIHIDSVKYNGDSIFYPIKFIRPIDSKCYSPYEPSWLGEKIIVENNGNCLFFNDAKDTIRIKTNALLNEEWDTWKLPDSNYVKAKVILWDTMSIIGLFDSVKTIAFQMYNKSHNMIDHKVNDYSVQLSRNYGLLKTPNFYSFPNEDSYNNEPLDSFHIVGLTNPAMGIQNLTWFDIYDFQPGDEIHTKHLLSKMGYSSITTKTIRKYLNRQDFQDSIIYTVEQSLSIHTKVKDSIKYEFEIDTITETIASYDTLFNTLPMKPIIQPERISQYSMYDNDTKKSNVQFFIYSDNDSCGGVPLSEGMPISETYKRGLGGPYYSHSTNDYEIERKELVFYIKGDVTWGSPLNLNTMESTEHESSIRVYPNPTKQFVNFMLEASHLPAKVEISDIQGKILMSELIIEKNASLYINDLTSGLYLYRVITKNDGIHTGKLMVK
ncbi:MAG: T9SS type A sorting domain-containing protein [Bacteroidales bacterium]|nr:T9SS type A sorting domain-containing protein [Bacteroidales bacterium]